MNAVGKSATAVLLLMFFKFAMVHMKNICGPDLQAFHIEIVPVDDGTPVLQINHGLEFLEQFASVVRCFVFFQ